MGMAMAGFQAKMSNAFRSEDAPNEAIIVMEMAARVAAIFVASRRG